MSKKVKAVILVTFLTGCVICLFLSAHLVVYVYPEEAGVYAARLSRPGFFNRGYLLVSRSDGRKTLMEALKKPDIVIYAPYAEREGGERSGGYFLEADGREYEVENSLYGLSSAFLSSLEGKDAALLHSYADDSSSLLFSSLHEAFPFLSEVCYIDRVSLVNMDEIAGKTENMYAVIVLHPEETAEFYRSGKNRIVMAETDAAAAVSLGSVISLHHDWDSIIRTFLTDGEVTPYYTFSVLHQ